MRGFPPVQIFLLGLAFVLLAIPLTHLTGDVHVAAVMSEPAKKAPETVPALVRLRYAHKPLTVSLKQEGRELLEKPDLAASPTEMKAKVSAGRKAKEFLLEATWPPGTPDTALTVDLEPDGLETRSQTCWSADARLSELIIFSW